MPSKVRSEEGELNSGRVANEVWTIPLSHSTVIASKVSGALSLLRAML